jgi:hypothetical protein
MFPVALGVKVTFTEHVPLAGRGEEETHVSLSAKSPEAATFVTTSPAAPTSVRVAVCGALVAPRARLPNVSDAGETLREGAGARLILATKASYGPPPYEGWKLPEVMGKSTEKVAPATYAFPEGSKEIPRPKSSKLPPR